MFRVRVRVRVGVSYCSKEASGRGSQHVPGLCLASQLDAGSPYTTESGSSLTAAAKGKRLAAQWTDEPSPMRNERGSRLHNVAAERKGES